jgi:hypothetical protein
MNPETKIQRRIMMALSSAGHTCWRNETGRFWSGKVIHKENSSVTLANAAMIPVGLCLGSSDLIGIQAGTGRFFAIEVKTATGRASKEQTNFVNHVKKMGGIAGIARSEQEALELLAR